MSKTAPRYEKRFAARVEMLRQTGHQYLNR
jgi:hypothetical protein